MAELVTSLSLMLTIREARPDDFEWVFQAVKRLTQMYRGLPEPPVIPGGKECYDAMINDPEHHHIVVAEADGKRVGCALLQMGRALHFGGRSAELQDLYVEESARRLGVGKALMKYLDEFATKTGLKATELYQLPPGSDLDEERNLFYKRAGYWIGGFARHKLHEEIP